MSILLAAIMAALRLIRPARGVHAVPRYAVDTYEAARVRAPRVRPYAAHLDMSPLPALSTHPGNPFKPPAPVISADEVHPPSHIVRGHYRDHEARMATASGVAV